MADTLVTDVPGIMRVLGWTNGAALMDHWFSLPAAEAPPYATRNDTIIKMSWILGFTRAKKIYDKMIADKVWSNQKGRIEVKKYLDKYALTKGTGGAFGVFQSTQPVIHANAVNFRVVDDDDTSDDLRAALANFTLHVQIGGTATPIAGSDRCRISVTQVGIYARDQYDFIGTQVLGRWDKATNTVNTSKLDFVIDSSTYGVFAKGTLITNASFRKWRDANKKGGDFEVFSDVSVVPLATPDVFEV